MTRLARGQGGFTLIELMIGLSIGLVVVLGGVDILDSSLRISRTTQARVDSSQRARTAMEVLTRELRSQVCLSATAPALTTATASNVIYYVNLGQVDAAPERHEIAMSGGDIVIRRWVGTGTPPSMTWPGTPTSTRTLVENVATYGGIPFLRYYAWQNGNPVLPTTMLPAPLTIANLAKPVKISLSFRTYANRDFRNTSTAYTDLQNSVFVRAADPVDTTSGPRC
jgi:prepilin-type N-terminal cleavage/methylation domain-containing protein